MSKATTIFGREPAAWVGLIEGLLMIALAFGLGIGQDTFGPIMAVVTALGGGYVAWATRDHLLGAALALTKAVIALVVVYGAALTDEQTAAIVGMVSLVVGFWQRTQTTPVGSPVDPSPTQVVNVHNPSTLPTAEIVKRAGQY